MQYLSQPSVWTAVHALRPVYGGGKIMPCAPVGYNLTWPSSIPAYQQMIASKLKVLVFSGDVDVSTCPAQATEYCFNKMDLAVEKNWTPFYYNRQTIGFYIRYQGLTFATVKGAGHEVPLFQPLEAFLMIQRMIATGRLDDPTSAEAVEIDATTARPRKGPIWERVMAPATP
jgi:serine carboxypeptidase-like clade 2